MKVHRLLLILGCLGVLATFVAPPAIAQQSAPQSTDPLSGSTPKDIVTRAKLHTELGSLYFQNGNLIIALEELTIATSINPNYAQAYSTRGLVLYYVKEYDSADKDFRRALSIDDRDPEINNNYGWFLCQIGRENESIEYFQRAIRNPLYQTPDIAYLNAGACHAKLGELDLAEEHIRQSLRFSPENPKALFQLAIVSYKRGNYDAAKLHLNKVVRLSDPDAEVLWLYLRTERRLGDTISESSLAAQLRRRYPDSPEYQKLLKGSFE
jgi:type IV pilus assembly protein PilF